MNNINEAMKKLQRSKKLNEVKSNKYKELINKCEQIGITGDEAEKFIDFIYSKKNNYDNSLYIPAVVRKIDNLNKSNGSLTYIINNVSEEGFKEWYNYFLNKNNTIKNKEYTQDDIEGILKNSDLRTKNCIKETGVTDEMIQIISKTNKPIAYKRGTWTPMSESHIISKNDAINMIKERAYHYKLHEYQNIIIIEGISDNDLY